MSDLETFFREEKERMSLPDETDDEYLARRHRIRLPLNPSHPHDVLRPPGTNIQRQDVVPQPNVSYSEERNVAIPSDTPQQQQTSKKRRSSVEKSVDPPPGIQKKRKLSQEHDVGFPVPEIGDSAMEPSIDYQMHIDPKQRVGDHLPDSTVHERSPASGLPIQSVASPTHPAEDTSVDPSSTNNVQKPGVNIKASSNSVFPSHNEDAPIRNAKQHVPIRSRARGISAETREASDETALITKTRTSSHATQTNTVLQSKVIKIFGDKGPEAAHSSSSITSPTASAPSSSKATATRNKKTITAEAKSAPLKKGKPGKKKRELITPLAYAQRLQEKLSEMAATRKSRVSPYLRGKRIFYYGGDMNYASEETRGRMDYIIKHGGTVVPTYDPAVITHIVTTDNPPKPPFLRLCGLRSLNEIPDHIPTVKWSWIISGHTGATPCAPARKDAEQTDDTDNPEGDKSEQIEDASSQPPNFHLMFHAAFKERLDAGVMPCMSKARPKPQKAMTLTGPDRSRATPSGAKGVPDNSEISTISEFTVDRSEPKESIICDFDDSTVLTHRLPGPSRIGSRLQDRVVPVAGSSGRSTKPDGPARLERDPLAPFYEQARAEREEDDKLRSRLPGDDDQEEEEADNGGKCGTSHAVSRKRGFLCDSKPEESAQCANQDVIDKLQELKELHKAKLSDEDKWRVLTYDKAIRVLRSYPTRIRSYEEARTIRGIGDKTAQKIIEILQTGNLRRIGYEKTEDVEAVNIFQGIYGVGRHIASRWFASGCRTLDDVRARKGGIRLSTCQEIGLKYYTDINSRMPRSEAGDIFNIIKPIGLAIDNKLFIEIMGSYRRGKADCGDIDILITRPTDDGKTHQGVLRKLLGELHRQGIITEDLSLPDSFDDLELVYRGLCRRDSSSTRRRIDFLTVPYESRGAALLYYTGDDIFNRSLRLKANKMGYSLNQRGLFQGVVRNPSNRLEKLNEGNIVASETEEEILRILGVPWQEPHERIRG